MQLVSIQPTCKNIRQGLIQPLQASINRIKVRHITGVFQYFSIADDAFFVYHKGGTFGNTFHIIKPFSVYSVVSGGGIFIKIAEEGEVEVLFFFELAVGKQGIYRYTVHLGIGIVVKSQVVPYPAELFGAGAGKSQGVKQQQYVFTPLFAEGYLVLFRVPQCKVGRLLADLNRHSSFFCDKDKGKRPCQIDWQAEKISLTKNAVISKNYMVLLKKWRNFALPPPNGTKHARKNCNQISKYLNINKLWLRK